MRHDAMCSKQLRAYYTLLLLLLLLLPPPLLQQVLLLLLLLPILQQVLLLLLLLLQLQLLLLHIHMQFISLISTNLMKWTLMEVPSCQVFIMREYNVIICCITLMAFCKNPSSIFSLFRCETSRIRKIKSDSPPMKNNK